MTAQPHQSNHQILNRRTLQHDHRALAAILRPGMSVLDVGCGTGAITIGIAQAVAPDGHVIALDRDIALLDLARKEYARQPNLQFIHSDITDYSIKSRFDVVTAARTLQWIANPALAIHRMAQACKPGGILLVLDYNHYANCWEPEPPPAFLHFYEAFLAWRAANGWDNRMADHLPALFEAAGLQQIQVENQDEIAAPADPDFSQRARLWPEVVESIGSELLAGGYCEPSDLNSARDAYAAWAPTHLQRQLLSMRAVHARVRQPPMPATLS